MADATNEAELVELAQRAPSNLLVCWYWRSLALDTDAGHRG